MKEAVSQILKEEELARKQVALAKLEAEKLIASAKKEAAEIVSKASQEAKALFRQQLKTVEQEFLEEREKLLKTAKDEVSAKTEKFYEGVDTIANEYFLKVIHV